MGKRKSLIFSSLLGSMVLVNSLSASDINATQQELIPSEVVSVDQFGYSVGISDNYAIVGANRHNDFRGKAYIFNLNATDINASQTLLTAFDGASSDSFGEAVAISNYYAIVGAYMNSDGKGSAYLYELNATDINTSQIKLTPKDGIGYVKLGNSVAINSSYAVVGGLGDNSSKGSAYLYELNATDINNSQIKLSANDGANDDSFGYSVALSNNYVIVGAYVDDNGDSNSGSVYLFELNATNINASQIKLTAFDKASNDYFGSSVAINGNYAIVGAYNDDNGMGGAYLYELNATDINASQKKLTAFDGVSNNYFGHSVAINDKYVVIGADKYNNFHGSVYLYELNATDINASQKKLTPNETNYQKRFGDSVAINSNYTIIGEYGDNKVYLFDLNNSLAIASNVIINGTIDIGETLTSNYDYSAGEGDSEVERGTTFQWYRANENNGSGAEAISGAISKTYTITTLDSGKYLAFGVTPKDGKEFGNEVNSSYTTMVPIKVDFNSSMVTTSSWNMISIPDEKNVTANSISGATIWTFNNSTNAWENPTTLEAGKGYMLYTTSSIGLITAQKVTSTITDDNTTIKSVSRNTWTLVGISKSTSGFTWKEIYTPTNTLKTGCAYTQIFYYDSVNTTWNTTTNIPYLSAIWVKQNCFGD